MAVIVVDRRRVVLGVLRREAPGIGRGGFAALRDDSTKGRIFVVCCHRAVSRDDIAHILVAVMRIEL